jgi:serine/threonine protein kinase
MGEKTAYYSKLGINPIYYDDRYELLSTIGRGKASVVYLTNKLSKDETIDIDSPAIALKVLLNTERDPENCIRRIKKESLALLSCLHPSIIRMHDYVARADTCYLSMEYAKYGDLKNLLKSDKAFLSPLATLKLTQELLSGVGAIHAAGILHRDIKPENILLAEDYQVKICDFSVCLLKGEKANLNLLSNVVGTIDYLAPESLSGKGYSVSSDLYSVAITAFELLTGFLPFKAKSINESVERKKKGEFEEIPSEIIAKFPTLKLFFTKALSPNIEERFNDNLEMSKALDEVIRGTFSIKKSTGVYKKIDLDRVKIDFSKTLDRSRNYFSQSGFDDYLRKYLEYVNKSKQIIKKLMYNSKILLRFFGLSFLTTIVFISFTNLFVGNAEVESKKIEIKSGDASAEVSNSYEYFKSKSGIGVINGLYTEDRNYRFVLTPISENKALFVLLVKGWEPVEVDIESLKEGKPINVVGKGLNILLKVSEVSEDTKVKGTYENLVTARMGKWTFDPIQK